MTPSTMAVELYIDEQLNNKHFVHCHDSLPIEISACIDFWKIKGSDSI